MADSEVINKLKDLPYKIQSSSPKERRQVIEDVREVLSNPGVNEQIVRALCRTLYTTLHRYHDSASRCYVKDLIASLTKQHKEWTLKHFPAIISDIAEQHKNLVASSSTSQSGLFALRWSCIVVENGLAQSIDADYVDFKGLVMSQAYLLTAVVAYGSRKNNQKAYSMLHQMWSTVGKNAEAKWLEVLLSQAPDAGPHVVIMASILLQHYRETQQTALCDANKAKILDAFIKSLISVKQRPNTDMIKGCKELLSVVDKNDLQSVLLPALQKAMLRNPEIIIQTVGCVFDNLNIHLGLESLEIGKSLIGNLHSKEDTVRVEAALALKSLSLRCAEVECVKQLLQHVFAVYNGANGKLTSSEHKTGVLLGAGNLSFTNAPQDMKATLTTNAISLFAKTLENETHEKTLCFCLDMLTCWTNSLVGDLPEIVAEIFKKNIGLKSTTQLVRIAYTQWLASCLRGHSSSPLHVSDKLCDTLKPLLLKAVEKAQAQPLQNTIVSEGVCAVYALVLLDVRAELPNKSVGLWNSITHADKNIFLQDKFLSAATDDVLTHVMLLCTTILEKYTNITAPVYRAIITVMLAPSWIVRKSCITSVRTILARAERVRLACNLAGYLNEAVVDNKLGPTKEKPEQTEVTGKMIFDCVTTLSSFKGYRLEDAQQLAIEILPCCHTPLVQSATPGLWIKILKYLKLEPKKLILLFANNLKQKYITEFQTTPTACNIVASLVSISPEIILPTLIRNVTETFENPELLQISRDEYFTYLTPEGELYDKSVIPANEDAHEMNMKRESKVYSYKEQQEELQLRREMEARRRAEGKVKEVVLSAKQKEAIRLQTNKEYTIRQRLLLLHERVRVAVSLVQAGKAGDAAQLSLHLRVLLPAVLPALQSPLAAPMLCQMYIQLKDVAMPARLATLAEMIGHITLRLYKPQCDLDPNWEEEDLNSATARTIVLIHSNTVASKVNHDMEDESGNYITQLTAPAFSYTFPLLKQGLSSFFAKSNEGMLHNGLQIITHHAKLRANMTSAKTDFYNPTLLPIQQMFQLLIDLIGSTTGLTQLECTAALLATANCASGQENCMAATDKEVDCLLSGLQSPNATVRGAALKALLCLKEVMPKLLSQPDYCLTLVKRLWIAKYDVTPENTALAEQVWEMSGCESMLSSPQLSGLGAAVLQEAMHPTEEVQQAAAQALAALLPTPHLSAAQAVKRLMDIYGEKLTMLPPKLDQFGHVTEEAVDEWWWRRGVGLALWRLAPLLDEDTVTLVTTFFVHKALGDRAEPVRDQMLNAAMTVVELHGKNTVSSQLPVFEEFLDKAPKSGGYDVVRQAVVLLVGSLARHLAPDDARIRPITLRLIASLSTPSQQVQEAVSNCLPHLVTSPVLKDDMPGIINKLMKQLLTGDKYGDRKGAAHGISGIVKGLGILALKQMDIMPKLTDAIQEKKNFKYREGSLFALEMLTRKLGRLFEPYIVHILPFLLLCFGDSSQYVRTAADDTAKVIMSRLSAHGVKLVLPSLLTALQDDSWRTKTGSVELLGSMAFCAPKQLSSCLPNIVPKLIEVLSDSHMKVQEAGAEALKVIGSVIRNPEIQAIVPELLLALQDPSNKTSVCLQTLLDTKFVHFIDAPSLALIMPVVQRAFIDRSTETRKMAAQIIGNMYSLTDQKDLYPYLPNIIPGLKMSLLDPVPEVRSVSARALGAMVRGMGEAGFDDLLPWLMQTLTSESSSVDRSGAAQGLSEVVAGLGVEKLHKLMPEIIATAERNDIAPHVKDGYIMMFIYMPGAFTSEFTPYIGQIINPILKALADENEYVRETALKAGQRIVNLYADSAITLLLPELENGLFDDNWRIRYSSVQLLGDLLYRISGVSGKMTTETASEDDNFGTEQSHSAIMRALGPDRRNRVLAGLYMGRSDVALMVRQAALHVWKVVVTNTPRTLREILPTLFGLLLGCLASTSYDKRQVAARTLGDLVRKLGERVLPEIIPILEKGLQSDRPDQRQGVCIGLSEIMTSTSRDMVLTFVDSLVPTVRKALCDPLPEVRFAAAKTFDSLHATVGVKALDDILPFMLEGLNDEDPEVAEAALDGLRQVMAIKSRAVLPYLVPQLTAPPANTRALSALAAAAGDALSKHLHKVLPALLTALANAQDASEEAKELEHCRGALLAVTDEAGVRSIVDSLLEASRSNNPNQRRAAAALLCAFLSHTRADLSQYVPQLLRGLIHLFGDTDRGVLQMAWEALQAVTKSLDAEQQIAHVSDVRQAVRFAVSDLKGATELPGFCLPKGITPILPLFRESILNGLPEDKENAALMLGEVIKLTSAPAIQPSVVHITGPLIRILGDRFNANVKAAVLETLALLLSKVGVMLKQFLPQLQTTFLKALSDANRQVRIKAGYALSQLVLIHTRADPLFVEMHNGIKNADDPSIRETMLQALRSVITGGGDKMSEPLVLSILATLTSPGLLGHQEDPPRSAVGGCLGALLYCLPIAHLDAALHHHIFSIDSPDWALVHGRSAALFVALKEHPEAIYLEQYEQKIVKVLVSLVASDKVGTACNGVRGIGYLLCYLMNKEIPVPQNLISVFVRSMNHPSNEVKQLVAVACGLLGRARPAPELLRAVLPALVNGTKEKNSYVKANSEIALISVLRLREGDHVHQQCMQLLDVGARESLNDVVSKVLRKNLSQPEGRDEELDCTIIT